MDQTAAQDSFRPADAAAAPAKAHKAPWITPFLKIGLVAVSTEAPCGTASNNEAGSSKNGS